MCQEIRTQLDALQADMGVKNNVTTEGGNRSTDLAIEATEESQRKDQDLQLSVCSVCLLCSFCLACLVFLRLVCVLNVCGLSVCKCA